MYDYEDEDEGLDELVEFFRDDLRRRFLKKTLEDLLNDNPNPYPTMLIEMERPEITELVRKFILFSPHAKPFTARKVNPQVREVLAKAKQLEGYGKLYILVNIN